MIVVLTYLRQEHQIWNSWQQKQCSKLQIFSTSSKKNWSMTLTTLLRWLTEIKMIRHPRPPWRAKLVSFKTPLRFNLQFPSYTRRHLILTWTLNRLTPSRDKQKESKSSPYLHYFWGPMSTIFWIQLQFTPSKSSSSKSPRTDACTTHSTVLIRFHHLRRLTARIDDQQPQQQVP